MDRLYRIYTEHKDVEKVAKIVGRYFKGFTLLNGIGYWQGVPEQSLVIEIIGTESDATKVELVAYEIKKANTQEAVLIQETNVASQLV